MTLVTAVANFDYVVHVSDRRLTTDDGKVFTDEECKAIHLRLPTADFLIGYTGLARIGHESTEQVLIDLLCSAAEKATDFDPQETVTLFKEALTNFFVGPRLRPYSAKNRRLTVMMTGFRYFPGDRHTIAQVLLTNFQHWGGVDDADAWDHFETQFYWPKAGEEWPTLVQRIGAYDALPLGLIEAKLRPLVERRGASPRIARDRIVGLLPAQSKAFPTIGSQANAAILRPAQGVEWTYHSAQNSWVSHIGSHVSAGPEGIVAFMGFMVEKVEKTGDPIHVPVVARNKPCPCGSGRRYRSCHAEKRVLPRNWSQED